MVTILFLGFSSGLPYALSFITLSVWFREVEMSRTQIGLFSIVGLPYALKLFWAPLIDRLPFPLLTRRLGQRRGHSPARRLIHRHLLGGNPHEHNHSEPRKYKCR